MAFHFVKSETRKQIIFVLRKNVPAYLHSHFNFFVCEGNNCQRFCAAVSLWKKSDQLFKTWYFPFEKKRTGLSAFVTLNFFVFVGNNCQRFCTTVWLWKKSDQKATYFNFLNVITEVQRSTVSLCKKWDEKTNYFRFEKKRTRDFKLFCMCRQ